MSYKYRPDEVAAQSVFGLAEVVDKHQAQVDGALLCGPLNLLQAPLNLLPSGTRPAILPYTFFRWGLPPLEGFRPAVPSLTTVRTGRAAGPQLWFHLTLHPIMLAGSIATFFCVVPFVVVHYTLHTQNQMFNAVSAFLSSRRARNSRGGKPPQRAATAATRRRGTGQRTAMAAAAAGAAPPLAGASSKPAAAHRGAKATETAAGHPQQALAGGVSAKLRPTFGRTGPGTARAPAERWSRLSASTSSYSPQTSGGLQDEYDSDEELEEEQEAEWVGLAAGGGSWARWLSLQVGTAGWNRRSLARTALHASMRPERTCHNR
jgi:hypothetical protein